jgi:hypothetical protein
MTGDANRRARREGVQVNRLTCSHDIQLVGDIRTGVTIKVCNDCGAWLSLGPSNDRPEAVRIEMRLAEFLAEHELKYCDGALEEIYEIALDIFADDEPPPGRPINRPLSPIEMMVDKACGFTRPVP